MTGIVVGVEASDGAANTLGWAVLEANPRGTAPGAIVRSVLDLAAVGRVARRVVCDDPGLLLPSVSRHWLHHGTVPTVLVGVPHRGPVGRRVVGVEVEPTVVRGSAAGAFVDADLVDVGSRGPGTWDRLLLGSVPSQVAMHARTPVAVVPPACPSDAYLPDPSSARSSS